MYYIIVGHTSTIGPFDSRQGAWWFATGPMGLNSGHFAVLADLAMLARYPERIETATTANEWLEIARQLGA